MTSPFVNAPHSATPPIWCFNFENVVVIHLPYPLAIPTGGQAAVLPAVEFDPSNRKLSLRIRIVPRLHEDELDLISSDFQERLGEDFDLGAELDRPSSFLHCAETILPTDIVPKIVFKRIVQSGVVVGFQRNRMHSNNQDISFKCSVGNWNIGSQGVRADKRKVGPVAYSPGTSYLLPRSAHPALFLTLSFFLGTMSGGDFGGAVTEQIVTDLDVTDSPGRKRMRPNAPAVAPGKCACSLVR